MQSRIGKSKLITRAALAGATALLSVAVSTGAATATARAAHTARTSSSGTVNLATVESLTTLDPQPLGVELFPYIRALYEPLVDINGTKNIPVLASSWKLGPRDRYLILDIRHGVQYSNGVPFTADDAAWVVNWMKQPSTGAQAVADWAYVTPKPLGRYTLELNFTRPMPDIFGLLSTAMMVLPNHQQDGIGTGPFEVASYSPGNVLTLRRNPHYWQKGDPKISRIVIKEYPDAASAALALQSGSANLVFGAQFSQITSLRSSGFKYQPAPGAGNYDILFNTSTTPLNNALVRQALSLAFDRSEFSKIALDGYAKPSYSIFPSSSPAYTKADDKGSLDLAKAKQLLHQAGYSSLSLSIDCANSLPQYTFLPIYKQDLAQIGINLTINPIDTATYVQLATSGNFPEMLCHAYAFGNSDPALLFIAFPFRPRGNAEHYNSAQYATMVGKASIAGNSVTRIGQYHAIDEFVQKEAFMMPLAQMVTPVLHSSNLKGLTIDDGTYLDFTNATLAG